MAATVSISVHKISHHRDEKSSGISGFTWIPTDPALERLEVEISTTNELIKIIDDIKAKYREAETLIIPSFRKGRRPNGYAKLFEGREAITTGA